MGLHLLADRGQLDWDAPVASYWPGFAKARKAEITVRVLAKHQAGLPYLDVPLTLAQCADPAEAPRGLGPPATQSPAGAPGARRCRETKVCFRQGPRRQRRAWR